MAFTKRVEVLFDPEHHRLLEQLARSQGKTVGALVRVGTGKLSPEAIRAMVEGKSVRIVGAAVPAKGLCLMRVNYEDFPPHDVETNEDL